MTDGHRGSPSPLAGAAPQSGDLQSTKGEAPPELAAAKRQLRREAATRRSAAARAAPAAGEALAAQVLQAIDLPAGALVSGYAPMRDEIDPHPLLAALAARGHGLCLPVVAGKGRPLVFRRWRPGAPLVEGAYGALVPEEGAETCAPAVLLVPLLAFDRAGYRLGYGGGFYDRTLAGLRGQGPVLAIGVAFAGQEVPAVPREATDQPLDWLATEAWTAKIA